MIEVANLRSWSAKADFVPICVGRPSALGNPFVLGRDGSREIVLNKYRNWLDAVLAKPEHPARKFFDRLASLHNSGTNLLLLCWCAPMACHADIVRERLLARSGLSLTKNMPRIAEDA